MTTTKTVSTQCQLFTVGQFFLVEKPKAMVLKWKGTSESALELKPHDTDAKSIDLEWPRHLYQNLQDVGLKHVSF